MKSTYPVLSFTGRPAVLFIVLLAGIASIIGSSNPPPPPESGIFAPHTGLNQSVRTGSLVVVDGRFSDAVDPDYQNTLYYRWYLKSRPNGSQAELRSDDTRIENGKWRVSFIADVDGQYDIELIMRSDRYKVTIDASTGNAAPVALPGPGQSVAIGDIVQLSGHGYDADNDPLTYSWQVHNYPTSQDVTHLLSDPSAAAPTLATESEELYAELTVSDGKLQSETNDIHIRVKSEADAIPNSRAGDDQYVTPGTMVTLDGRNSSDPYKRPLSYLWKVLSAPEDVSLNGADTALASFTPVKEGGYLFALRVDNGTHMNTHTLLSRRTGTDRLAVYVASNRPPRADGGPDHSVTTGTTLTMDASASSDPEGAALGYQWSVFSKPAGSIAQPIPFDGQSTQFTPDVDGTYLLRLAVNDGELESPPDIIRVYASGSQTTELNVLTALPYTPVDFEVATWVQMSTNGSNDLRLISSADDPGTGYETIQEITFFSATTADFNTYGSAWQVESAPTNPVSDASTPSFILKRNSDGRYFMLTMDFTALEDSFTVRVDALQGWDCGFSPANCP